MKKNEELGDSAERVPAEDTTITPAAAPYTDDPAWPKPIGDCAFIGILGYLVKHIEERTEADRNALLVLGLVQCGNRIGRGRFIEVGADRHSGNLFAAIVGKTSSGRKSSALSLIEKLLNRKEGKDVRNRIISGLSTGEGLIQTVRDGGAMDPITRRVDPGVRDKRLLIRETEFARVLIAMDRHGNTLSPVLRDAWDHGNLSALTKNQPVKATGAHVSLMVAITIEELLFAAEKGDFEGGLLNRILWVCSRRSKALPEGGRLADEELTGILDVIDEAHEFALSFNEALTLTAEAQKHWGLNATSHEGLYATLTAERGGRWGQVTARAAPNVLRLAVIFAAMDLSNVVELEHLVAAAEVWRYCDDSARFVFGSTGSGNRLADVIWAELVRVGATGMTRTEISKFLGHNSKASSMEKALQHLVIRGLASKRTPYPHTGPGRRAEIWFAVPKLEDA